MQRSTMQDAISAPKVGGIVRLTRFILKGTFLIEAAGAVLLLPVFLWDYKGKGIWLSVFHSISAFLMQALVFYLQMKMEALKECFPKGSLLQIPELLAEKMSDVFSYMIFPA